MNFRRDITSFKREEVNIVTDLIFNKDVESNEEIINNKLVDKETTEEIINILKVDGYIDSEVSLNGISIKPLCVPLDSLIQDGLYKPEQ